MEEKRTSLGMTTMGTWFLITWLLVWPEWLERWPMRMAGLLTCCLPRCLNSSDSLLTSSQQIWWSQKKHLICLRRPPKSLSMTLVQPIHLKLDSRSRRTRKNWKLRKSKEIS
jgi:hypothetical protein